MEWMLHMFVPAHVHALFLMIPKHTWGHVATSGQAAAWHAVRMSLVPHGGGTEHGHVQEANATATPLNLHSWPLRLTGERPRWCRKVARRLNNRKGGRAAYAAASTVNLLYPWRRKKKRPPELASATCKSDLWRRANGFRIPEAYRVSISSA